MSSAAPPPAAEPHEGLPNPRRSLAFLTIALGIVMAVLDGTAVNVALPTIARDLGASAAESVWIVTAHQLTMAAVLLPMAALGEAIGFRKVFLAGTVIFVAASLACALSTSLGMLVAARVMQGFGAAAESSCAGALVRFIMPPALLGRGIARTVMTVAVSATAGPAVAGAILAVASWHWLFLINVPVAVLCLALGRLTLPRTPASGKRFDLKAAALNALTLGPLISGLSSIGIRDVAWWVPAGQIAVALVAGLALVRREMARPAPMLPVDLFRIKAFSLSVAASVTSFAAQMLMIVSLPFIFTRLFGFGEVKTGLLMTPWPLAAAFFAPISARLIERFHAPHVSGLGSLVFALGLVSLALLPDQPATFDIVWRLVFCGIGFGLFQSPNNKALIASTPLSRSGGAVGMQATARVLGQSAGAAAAAIVFGVSGGYDPVFTMGIAAGFAAAAAVLSIWR